MTKEQGDGDARFSKTQENLWNQIWVSRSSHTELQIKPNGTLADRIFDLFFCKCSPSSPHCSYLVISNRRRMNARGFSWNQMFASQMALQPVSLSTHLRVVTGTQTSWSSISGVYLGVRYALKTKKRYHLGNFPHMGGGGIFPNPKTFVNLPSIFLYAKFILRC